MTTEERLKIATRAKLCLRCHDPEFVYQGKRPGPNRVGPRHDCPVQKGKKCKFTCKHSTCSWHLWICVDHKEENKADLERTKANLQKKGVVFAFPSSTAQPTPQSSECEEGHLSVSSSAEIQVLDQGEPEVRTIEVSESDSDRHVLVSGESEVDPSSTASEVIEVVT